MSSTILVPSLDSITVNNIIDRDRYRCLTEDEIKTLSTEQYKQYMNQPVGFVGTDRYKRYHVQAPNNDNKHRIIWDQVDSCLFREWAFESQWDGLLRATTGYLKFKDLFEEHLGSADIHKMNDKEVEIFLSKAIGHVRNWVRLCVKQGTARHEKIKLSNGDTSETFSFVCDTTPNARGFAAIDPTCLGASHSNVDPAPATSLEMERAEVQLEEDVNARLERIRQLILGFKDKDFPLMVGEVSKYLTEAARREMN
ncbi:hypothetical protein TWF481_010401 [Arthrobotrys musiformis]|uniref:Uncharacterized protein n=1 Tax=Arthrobotrys musiformis TaxID=47236 RepID=A0AAV9W224_9PEZI